MAETEQARASCFDCRRLKRGCSRELPSCALCKRVGRPCQYDNAPATPSSTGPSVASGASSQHATPPSSRDLIRSAAQRSSFLNDSQPSTPGQRNAAPTSFPAAWFLDSLICRGSTVAVPRGLKWEDLVRTPRRFTPDEAWSVAELHFTTTQSLEEEDISTGTSMKLIAEPPSSTLLNPSYESFKVVMTSLERTGQISVDMLAAYTLLAVYEIGHALYPAAYITVGTCVRIGCILGFHDKRKATQVLPRAGTWVEMEERRRIWWAVLTLDRCVSTGFRFRPLAASAIPADEILPAADSAWDVGELAVNPLLVMSMEAQTLVSPFARSCQAAHILGRVLEHVNEHATADADFHFQEAQHISRAAEALLVMLHAEADGAAASHDRLAYFLPRALCYSALMVLYDVHACIEVDDIESVGGNRGLRLDLQQLAIDGFKNLIAHVSTFALEVDHAIEQGQVDQISPLLSHCIYSAGGTYGWYHRETGDVRHLDALQKLRGTLEKMTSRWTVAGEYLNLLSDQENTITGAAVQ